MGLQNTWEEALAYIQAKVPKEVFETWFLPSHLERLEGSSAHIQVPNKFFGDWLA
ncbi:MAG: DnaA N-terminal domain-containing protein, partial [Nitrospiraceae bacterium]